MSDDPRELLLSQLLEGPGGECDEALNRALAADESLRAEGVELLEIDRQLRFAEFLRSERPDLLAGVLSRLHCEAARSDRFRQSVLGRVEQVRPARRRSAQLASLAAAVLLLVAGAIWWWGARQPAATIACVTVSCPHALVVRDGRQAVAAPDMVLQVLDRISTQSAGGLMIQYADGSTIELGPETQLLLGQPKVTAKYVRVERGLVNAGVAPQPSGSPMTLSTPHALITVIGTRFEIRVAPESTRLEVFEGQVRLARVGDGVAAEVPAGHMTDVAAGGALEVRPVKPQSVQAIQPRRPVFVRDFDSIPVGEATGCEVVRLPGDKGEITAIASRPCPVGTPTWEPEVTIDYYCVGAKKMLYALPKDAQIRIRIRSEKAGTWMLSQRPAEPLFDTEHFAAGDFEAGTDWREVVISASEMKPYRGVGPSRDPAPGMAIDRFGIYGTGTGRLFIDRFEVVSSITE